MSYRDAHVHLAAGAVDLSGLDLRSVASVEDVALAVRGATQAREDGALIRGWGFRGHLRELDALEGLAPRHPVVLARADGHAAWLNAAAREAFGRAGAPPVVEEEALEALRARLPAPSPAERAAAVRARMDELVALGVGAVDDMVDRDGPDLYARLRDRGELRIAVGLWLPAVLTETDARAIRRAFPPDDPRVAVRGIKIFLDGTLRSRTAALHRPYADDPGNDGRLRAPAPELRGAIAQWAEGGWPVALHAIGDRAVTLALDALEPLPAPRFGAHRIEHAQVVRREDLPRFGAAGIVASLQPGHWTDDQPWIGERLRERPEVIVHPLGSLARAGASIAIGSDWPVGSWDPRGVLAAAADPSRGEEAVSAADASAWYTSGPR